MAIAIMGHASGLESVCNQIHETQLCLANYPDISVHSHSLSTIPEANQGSVDHSGPETTKKNSKKGCLIVHIDNT